MNEEFSYFIEKKALFGSYPSGFLNTLQELNVVHFVDLTHAKDDLPPYKNDIKNCDYISYPIYDRSTPINYLSFCKLIIKISQIINSLKDNNKIYIHCKGGHGRCGILVACLLCYMNKLAPEDAITLTTKYHNNRDIKLKWKRIGSPQTKKQKCFIFRLFKPIYFYKSFKNTPTYGFSTFSPHPIETKKGIFPTIEAAFNAYKDINNNIYVDKLKQSISPYYSRQLGKTKHENVEFRVNKYNIMYNLYKLKYKQYMILRENLKQTFLRPIIFNAKTDTYWGNGNDASGLNCLGNILTNLRNEFIFDTPQLTNTI